MEPTITYSNDELASKWLAKTRVANKHYNSWANRFKCDTLEDYYYGFQWKDSSQAVNYERYVINYIFSTIEIKLPSLLFQNPVFHIKPRPRKSDFDLETAVFQSQMKEDALNTIFSDPDNGFNEELELFIKDSFFYFGIMEVGYSSDWLLNPNAGKPVLRSDNEYYYDEEDNLIKEPQELPQNERIYIRRIKPWRFRVGGLDGSRFQKCNWIGYFDYVRTADLKEDKNLKNRDKILFAGSRTEEFQPDERDHPELDEYLKTGDITKIWRIWDLAAGKHYIFGETAAITLSEKKMQRNEDGTLRIPLIDLRWVTSLRQWYPVPPAFNWKPPQDELNETREAMRIHRRRTKRVYVFKEGAFEDDAELDKLENGPDMTMIKCQGNVPDAIQPLASAPLDNTIKDSLIVSKDDFNIITATSSEQRGQADRTTATQANLIDQGSKIRDSRMSIQAANAFCAIGRLVLLTIQDKMTLPFWVELSVDSEESFLSEFQETKKIWTEMTSKKLGDGDNFNVSMTLESLSPIENAAEKSKFIDFLSVLTHFPQIAFDATLVREAAYRCGYRNEKVIRRMAQMAQVSALGQMEQAKQSLGQQQGGAPSNVAQNRVAQMAPPTIDQIRNQMAGQG